LKLVIQYLCLEVLLPVQKKSWKLVAVHSYYVLISYLVNMDYCTYTTLRESCCMMDQVDHVVYIIEFEDTFFKQAVGLGVL